MDINKNMPSMPLTIPLTESMLSIASIREADLVVHRQLIGGNENQRSEFLKRVSKNYYTQVMTSLQSIWNKYNQTKNTLELSTQLNQFLGSSWLPPMYTAFPENPATKLLAEVAFNLAKQDKSSALDKLFNKNIPKETISNRYNDLSDASVEDILHILKTHVLWDNYLIPVKVLAEKRNDPDSLWHKNGLYNPYFTVYNNSSTANNYLFISPAIYQRIIQHSDTTRQINDYQEAYTKTQEDAGSLLGQLILLGKRFSSNDSHTGIGKSTQAGIGAAIAFMQFYCDFYEHINATQKSTIPEALRNEIELIKNHLSQAKYTLELISNLPNHNRQNAKPRTIYLAEDGRYILKNMAGSVVEGMLDTQQISLKNLTQNLNKQELLDNILAYLAHNGGHTPTPEQINTDQMSTCIGTRGYNLRQLTARHQTILSKIVLDQQYQTSCITAVKSVLNQALTEFETSLNNKSYQGNDALIITPTLLEKLNITINLDSDAKLGLLDPLTTDECDQLFTQKPALLNQIKQLLTTSETSSRGEQQSTLSIEKLVWLITGMPFAPLNSLLAHLKKAPYNIQFTERRDILALLITLTPEKLAIVCQHCINAEKVSVETLLSIAQALEPVQQKIFNEYHEKLLDYYPEKHYDAILHIDCAAYNVYGNYQTVSSKVMLNVIKKITQKESYIKNQVAKYLSSNFLNHWTCSIYGNNKNDENKVRAVYAHIQRFYEHSITTPETKRNLEIMIAYQYAVHHYGIKPQMPESSIKNFIQRIGSSKEVLEEIQTITQNNDFVNAIKNQINKMNTQRNAIVYREKLFNSLNIPDVLMFLENSLYKIFRSFILILDTIIFAKRMAFLGLGILVLIFPPTITINLTILLFSIFLGSSTVCLCCFIYEFQKKISPGETNYTEIITNFFEKIINYIMNEYLNPIFTDKLTLPRSDASELAQASVDYEYAIYNFFLGSS